MKSRKLLSVPIWSLIAQRLWTVQQMWGIFMEGVSVFAVVKLWGGPLGVSKIFLCTVEGCSEPQQQSWIRHGRQMLEAGLGL